MTKRNRNLTIASAVLLFLLFFHKFIFFSHWQTVTVVQNDAPHYCSTGGRRGFLRRSARERSSVPERGHYGYCGAVITDRGSYLLPDDYYTVSLHQSRGDLQERLVEGCRFEVLIVGYGRKFRYGYKQRVPLLQTISWVWRELGCT